MQVHLPTEQRSRMKSLLRQAGRREIGGILMGEMIGPDRFRIVDFSVDMNSGSRSHFIRSPAHHNGALADFFSRTGADYTRFNYLGEWHSHPSFRAVPSLDDIQAMQDLVRSGEISFAVLLIVRLRFWHWLECGSLCFVHDAPHPFAVDLICHADGMSPTQNANTKVGVR